MRGVSPCGGNSTQSSVNKERTPFASPLSQVSSYFLCTCLIFSTSLADKLPCGMATVGYNSKAPRMVHTLRLFTNGLHEDLISLTVGAEFCNRRAFTEN